MISQRRSVKTRRGPDFNVPFFRSSSGRIKTRRHHADDPIQISIHPHAFIQNVSVTAEESLPETVANYNFRNKTGCVIIRIETSSEFRLDTQELEVIRRHEQ